MPLRAKTRFWERCWHSFSEHLGRTGFYLGNNRLGFLYAAFFWTGIPSICGLVECFFMPGRVRAYNFAHAQELAARAGVGPWAVPVVPAALAMVCPACGQHVAGVAQFCTRCGASTATVPQVASI